MNKLTTAAVIVTHNPTGDIGARIKTAAAEADQIVVVDNASDTPIRAIIENIQKELPEHMECIWNKENKGLAAALNQGINRALEKNAEWVLLLDHDSQPQPGMVAAMLRTHATWPRPEKIALIAPNIREENVASATRYLLPWGKFGFRRIVLNIPATDEALTVITSGSLIKAAAFRRIGLMPEPFFIDYIDHAFCLRLKEQGLDILLVKDAVLRHRLGNKTAHRLGGLTIISSNHNSFRRYHIFRNRIWVWRCYGRRFPGFVLHDFLASMFDILRIIAYEDGKLPKLKAVCREIAAGFGKSCIE